jgi:hypothetical protein
VLIRHCIAAVEKEESNVREASSAAATAGKERPSTVGVLRRAYRLADMLRIGRVVVRAIVARARLKTRAKTEELRKLERKALAEARGEIYFVSDDEGVDFQDGGALSNDDDGDDDSHFF